MTDPIPSGRREVLDILKANGIKAAFFLVGVNAEKYPDLVRRIVAEGHEIGNHTYYHPDLADLLAGTYPTRVERHAAAPRDDYRPLDHALSPALRGRHQPFVVSRARTVAHRERD